MAKAKFKLEFIKTNYNGIEIWCDRTRLGKFMRYSKYYSFVPEVYCYSERKCKPILRKLMALNKKIDKE